MRVRSWGGLTAAVVVAMLAPATVFAQSDVVVPQPDSWILADNPDVYCEAPLPASMVVGDLGSTIYLADEAQIDKVTLASTFGASVLDVQWSDDGHNAEITTNADVTAYITWSCAPLNGEPIQRNAPQQV